MTRTRTAFLAFQERMATEQNRPLLAFAKATFIAFVGFNLLMGFLLGTVPLARNIYFHFIYHIAIPVNTWFLDMGWEGQVTQFALAAAGTMGLLYIMRNYLALALRGLFVIISDIRDWITKPPKKKPMAMKAVTVPKQIRPMPSSNTQPPETSRPMVHEEGIVYG